MYKLYTAVANPVIFVVMGLIAFGLKVLLKNKSAKVKNIPFIVVAVIFLCLETSKQIYEFCQPDGYRLYSIPLHVCSFFVFFPIFAACLKQDWKITKIFWSLSINSAVIVAIAMVFAPEIIYGDAAREVILGTGNYIQYHSVTHHAFIVLFMFLVIFLKPWKPNLNESIWAAGVFGAFLIFAWIMANALNTDFSSFIRYGTGFFMQLAVWLVHLVCFSASSAIIFLTQKLYRKWREKKQ